MNNGRLDMTRYSGRAARLGLLLSMPIAFVVLAIGMHTGWLCNDTILETLIPYRWHMLIVGIAITGAAGMLSIMKGAHQ